MLEIYSQAGQLKAVIEPSDNSRENTGVMEIGVLGLSFTLPEFVQLDVNDYIDFLDVRYTLFDDYRPEHISDQEFKYDVQFFGPEKWLERAQVLATVDVEDEGDFALTDTARVHLQLYVDNMNRITGSNRWVIGQVVESDNIVIEYTGKNCLVAINELAEKTGTEWWMEGYTMNLSRCEYGESLVLGYGHGLLNLSKEKNDKTPFFTRLYPVGGTRNIDRGSYGHQRLQLPGGVKYIEKNTQYGIFERSESEAFAHIYPHRVGYVSAVRSEEVTDDEGKPYTIYYFKDSGLDFDPNSYEIAGLVKHIAFEGGLLNGTDFEANYNSETGEFELITQFPYENMQLPGGGLVPQVGDPYILWNIRMPDEYIAAAERELLDAANDYIAKGAIDTGVYKAKTHYIDLDRRGIRLVKGRRVLLESAYYFDEGSRPSRITKISRNLARPNDATIECAYAVTPGTIAVIESDITKLQAAFAERLSRDVLQILRSWDSADPTEYNVFSSKRSRMEHLSRLYPDVARGFINFLKGIAVGEDASFAAAVSSPEFLSGFLDGKGWAIRLLEEINAAGATEKKAVAEFDDVVVRRSLRVFTLVINQTRAENGNIVFSDGMEVDHVDPATGRIYLTTDGGTLYNPFHPGDILLSQRFSGMPSEANGYEVSKQYEFVVTDAGIGEDGTDRLDWVSFRNFTGDIASIEKGDVIVRVDNLTDPARKGIIMMVTNGPDAPYIDVVYGLKTDPADAVKSRSGNLAGITNPHFGALHGFGHYAQNFYGVGDFRLRMGRDVQTAVDMIEGLSRTTMQKAMYRLTEDDNFLKNATFTERMEFWECQNAVRTVTVGGQLLMQNRALMSVKEIVAAMVEHNGRNVLRIKDSYVRQANEHIRQPDVTAEDVTTTGGDGTEVTETKTRRTNLYLSLRMICREPGTLTVGFEGAGQAADDFGQAAMPFVVQDVEAGSETEPVTLNWQGTWDGVGDFLLSFTGDAYFDQLALTSKPLDDFKVQVSTRFEQTAERIIAEGQRIDEVNRTLDTVGLEISAIDATLTLYGEHIDDIEGSIGTVSLRIDSVSSSLSVTASRVNRIDGDVSSLTGRIASVESAGYITRPEGNTLWASKSVENGATIVSLINQTADEIQIRAGKIKLEGYVTANGNVAFTTAGDIIAKNAEIEGKVTAASGGASVIIDPTIPGIVVSGSKGKVKIDVNNAITLTNSANKTVGSLVWGDSADSQASAAIHFVGNKTGVTQQASNIFSGYGILFNGSGGNCSFTMGESSVTGRLGLKLYNLPTSASGLSKGEVWQDGTTLRIVAI